MSKVTTQPSCRIYSGHQYLGRHRGLIQLTEVLQIMIVLHVCSTSPSSTFCASPPDDDNCAQRHFPGMLQLFQHRQLTIAASATQQTRTTICMLEKLLPQCNMLNSWSDSYRRDFQLCTGKTASTGMSFLTAVGIQSKSLGALSQAFKHIKHPV